ncbi:hypothetical protein [Deinococcus sp. JMULE3]|uniref:hypothetical protein n=1 Tax=Deinococcus sp. JMULE3 TaxID=2518341 RepID=UPI0020C62247|nr:hypothetical protein [Deinococcus sp. JMULE3]
MTPAAFTAVQAALSDLMRVHTPRATLLASLGDEVLRVRADTPPNGPDWTSYRPTSGSNAAR